MQGVTPAVQHFTAPKEKTDIGNFVKEEEKRKEVEKQKNKEENPENKVERKARRMIKRKLRNCVG